MSRVRKHSPSAGHVTHKRKCRMYVNKKERELRLGDIPTGRYGHVEFGGGVPTNFETFDDQRRKIKKSWYSNTLQVILTDDGELFVRGSDARRILNKTRRWSRHQGIDELPTYGWTELGPQVGSAEDVYRYGEMMLYRDRWILMMHSYGTNILRIDTWNDIVDILNVPTSIVASGGSVDTFNVVNFVDAGDGTLWIGSLINSANGFILDTRTTPWSFTPIPGWSGLRKDVVRDWSGILTVRGGVRNGKVLFVPTCIRNENATRMLEYDIISKNRNFIGQTLRSFIENPQEGDPPGLDIGVLDENVTVNPTAYIIDNEFVVYDAIYMRKYDRVYMMTTFGLIEYNFATGRYRQLHTIFRSKRAYAICVGYQFTIHDDSVYSYWSFFHKNTIDIDRIVCEAWFCRYDLLSGKLTKITQTHPDGIKGCAVEINVMNGMMTVNESSYDATVTRLTEVDFERQETRTLYRDSGSVFVHHKQHCHDKFGNVWLGPNSNPNRKVLKLDASVVRDQARGKFISLSEFIETPDWEAARPITEGSTKSGNRILQTSTLGDGKIIGFDDSQKLYILDPVTLTFTEIYSDNALLKGMQITPSGHVVTTKLIEGSNPKKMLSLWLNKTNTAIALKHSHGIGGSNVNSSYFQYGDGRNTIYLPPENNSTSQLHMAATQYIPSNLGDPYTVLPTNRLLRALRGYETANNISVLGAMRLPDGDTFMHGHNNFSASNVGGGFKWSVRGHTHMNDPIHFSMELTFIKNVFGDQYKLNFPMVANDGCVYIGSNDANSMIVLDPYTDLIYLKNISSPSVITGSQGVVTMGGLIIHASANGKIHLIDPKANVAREIGSRSVSSQGHLSAVTKDNKVIFQDSTGKAYRIDPMERVYIRRFTDFKVVRVRKSAKNPGDWMDKTEGGGNYAIIALSDDPVAEARGKPRHAIYEFSDRDHPKESVLGIDINDPNILFDYHTTVGLKLDAAPARLLATGLEDIVRQAPNGTGLVRYNIRRASGTGVVANYYDDWRFTWENARDAISGGRLFMFFDAVNVAVQYNLETWEIADIGPNSQNGGSGYGVCIKDYTGDVLCFAKDTGGSNSGRSYERYNLHSKTFSVTNISNGSVMSGHRARDGWVYFKVNNGGIRRWRSTDNTVQDVSTMSWAAQFVPMSSFIEVHGKLYCVGQDSSNNMKLIKIDLVSGAVTTEDFGGRPFPCGTGNIAKLTQVGGVVLCEKTGHILFFCRKPFWSDTMFPIQEYDPISGAWSEWNFAQPTLLGQRTHFDLSETHATNTNFYFADIDGKLYCVLPTKWDGGLHLLELDYMERRCRLHAMDQAVMAGRTSILNPIGSFPGQVENDLSANNTEGTAGATILTPDGSLLMFAAEVKCKMLEVELAEVSKVADKATWMIADVNGNVTGAGNSSQGLLPSSNISGQVKDLVLRPGSASIHRQDDTVRTIGRSSLPSVSTPTSQSAFVRLSEILAARALTSPDLIASVVSQVVNGDEKITKILLNDNRMIRMFDTVSISADVHLGDMISDIPQTTIDKQSTFFLSEDYSTLFRVSPGGYVHVRGDRSTGRTGSFHHKDFVREWIPVEDYWSRTGGMTADIRSCNGSTIVLTEDGRVYVTGNNEHMQGGPIPIHVVEKTFSRIDPSCFSGTPVMVRASKNAHYILTSTGKIYRVGQDPVTKDDASSPTLIHDTITDFDGVWTDITTHYLARTISGSHMWDGVAGHVVKTQSEMSIETVLSAQFVRLSGGTVLTRVTDRIGQITTDQDRRRFHQHRF